MINYAVIMIIVMLERLKKNGKILKYTNAVHKFINTTFMVCAETKSLL